MIEVRDSHESLVKGVKEYVGLRIAHVVAKIDALIDQVGAIAVRLLEQLQIDVDIVHRPLMQHRVHTEGSHAPASYCQLALLERAVGCVVAATDHIVQLEVTTPYGRTSDKYHN